MSLRPLLGMILLVYPVLAQLPPPQEEAYCWAVADGGDSLIFINKDGDGYDNRGPVGVSNIEAIAFNPSDGRLYTCDNDDFGFLDYNDSDNDMNDSEFIAIGAGIGNVTLPDGTIEDINDVDGMQFDMTRMDDSTGTFVLWATDRESDGSDILFQIDPNTGDVDLTPTPGFANGATAVRVSGVGSLIDVDDFAVDPLTGVLYAINNDAGTDDQFGVVDPVTGHITFIATFNNTDAGAPANEKLITDMEGFSFSMTGQLYGTTGGSASGSADNKLWLIDKSNGDTTFVAALDGGNTVSDFESCACLTDNVISGTVFYDLDNDATFDPNDGEQGFSNATVHIYIDTDNSGTVNAGDQKLCDEAGFGLACPVTDVNGFYHFPVGQGNFVATVDASTVPAGSTLTDPQNIEEADFLDTDFGKSNLNNDFGFTLPTGSGNLTINKTSNVVGNAVQGQTIQYTITVGNTSGSLQTGISLSDALPTGVTYVANSTSVTGPAEVFFADDFSGNDFSGNDGTKLFAGDWTEVDEEGGGAGAGAGQIQVSSGVLRLDDAPDSAGEPAAARTLDLTGFTRPILSFDFTTSIGVAFGDTIRVEASTGGAFTTLGDITGITGISVQDRVFDLQPFITATTTIRFRVVGSYHDADDFIQIDNLEIREAHTWRDEWESASYANSDGTSAWAMDWLEITEADGVAAGDIRQTAFSGRNVLKVSGTSKGLQREMDLSDYDSARLSLEYFRDGLDDGNDYISVEISSNAGGNWSELIRFRGPDNESMFQFISWDISNFISANTRIRFRTNDANDNTDALYVDNIMIDVRRAATVTKDNIAAGANPDLIDGGLPVLIDEDDRFLLADSTSLTATFSVTVDNPLDIATTTLKNTALATSNESPLPNIDDHTDNVVRGTLGDYVWNDANANGVQDGGEAGIANVTVELYDGSCTLGTDCLTAVTDGAGAYLFNNLAPGTYAVHVDDSTLPAGMVGTVGNADPSADFVVTTNESSLTADFGYYLPGTVSGHLYIDTNGNGSQDGGEPDLANVDVVVTDVNGTPQTVSTDANGDWAATVPPGDTSANIDETDPQYPTGYTQSEGTDPNTVTAVSGVNTDAGIDGFFLPGTVNGHLYIDTNGDGTQNAGEPNLANVNVVVTDSNGSPQTVVSDANGDWSASVPPGSTSADVDETDPEYPTGYSQTEGNDPTVVVAVAGINTSAGNDGYYLPGTVSGHLYLDTNGDGSQDIGEPDLVGVDVIVTDVNSSPQTVTSDGSGNWSATVPPGSTSADVDETDPEYPTGYSQSEGDDPTVVTAVAGVNTNAGNDGYYLAGTINGHLYLDTNNNNTQDKGEPNLPGVDVVITDINSTVQRVTSDASGNWSAIVPPGLTSADVDETDPDFPAGAAQTEGDDPTNVNAVAGANTSAGNDGYYVQATVSGHLYLDYNNNGSQDEGEPDLSGVDVVVTASDDSTQTVTTDASGNWSASVPAGSTQANIDESDEQYPTGSTQTEGDDPTTVTAVMGSNVSAGNDGFFVPGSIGDLVWLDLNGDGTQDVGEEGIANVPLALYLDDALVSETTTGIAGDYLFDNLVPGNYRVVVDTDAAVLTGMVRTTTCDDCALSLSFGEANLDADFGYRSGDPVLVATKEDTLLIDDAQAIPGDSIRYTITVENTGNGAANGVVFTSGVDENTTLDNSSITTSQGEITSGQGQGDAQLAIAIGDMNPGDVVTITFEVMINNPFPEGVLSVTCQGTVTADNHDPVPTDDPETPVEDDSTETDVLPLITALKSSVVIIDLDGDQGLDPGETLRYTILINNEGPGNAEEVVFIDELDPNTDLVIGSLNTSHGEIILGDDQGETSIRIELGELTPNDLVTVTFDAQVHDPIPDDVVVIRNQGLVQGANFQNVPTDDPDSDPDDDDTVDVLYEEVVPTLGEWALIILMSFMALIGTRFVRKS